MALRVYNTLSRQKEQFETVKPGQVGMYLCGPTVYKPSHIGHMVGPVIFDTVKRFLTYLGYKVTFVVNITDVDDKLIVRARELNTTVAALAGQMTADYLSCLKQLGVNGIDHMPRATEHIGGMIEIMQGLIDKGYAYAAGGDVYFDISRDEDYGKLCNRDPSQLEAGTRVEVSDRKRNPGDFALWKGAKPGEPSWESPWGPGRPGWHIECSAMSSKLLGKTLDIHGGGLDLQFPHHENELAQSESYNGTTFARYWMHNGLMRIRKQAGKVGGRGATDNGEATKMSGSVGNVINVADLLRAHAPETIRLLLLATHYRSPIEYSEERLAETRRSLDGFYRFFERYQRVTGESFHALAAPSTLAESSAKGLPESSPWRQAWQAFVEHMEDDFNTGGGVAVLYELLNRLNRFADDKKVENGGKPEDIAELKRGAVVLRELGQILGLFREAPEAKGDDDALVGGLMQLLIDLRNEARKSKNFALGDQIRNRLKELNVTLEDRAGGTGWRVGT
jgi:cysteinyl-tRNA synthetase